MVAERSIRRDLCFSSGYRTVLSSLVVRHWFKNFEIPSVLAAFPSKSFSLSEFGVKTLYQIPHFLLFSFRTFCWMFTLDYTCHFQQRSNNSGAICAAASNVLSRGPCLSHHGRNKSLLATGRNKICALLPIPWPLSRCGIFGVFCVVQCGSCLRSWLSICANSLIGVLCWFLDWCYLVNRSSI